MELIMENHHTNGTNGDDPSLIQYESSLYKFKDERDAIQKKTFTKWVNKHLKKANKELRDLFQDLRDGLNLISLLEVLSNEILPREKGTMRFHMLQNVQIALDFLRFRKIKLVNIRAEDIVDGNPKLTLGLIWTIILHFQISDIITHQTDERITAKEALLRWAQRTTDRYPGVRVGDFTNSWKDGLAFNAIIHRNRPDLIDYRSCLKRSARDNLDSAFTIAERELNVTKLLDPEDVDTHEPDEKSLITYISSLYDVFPRPPAHNPFADDDNKVRRIEEYREQSASLYLWMRETLSLLQDRNFPNTLVEMKSLLADCTRFRVEDVPPRLHDKQRLAHMYREIQKSYSNCVEITEELRIESIERTWNKLMSAHQERDQAIHDEIARLEKLQRLAEKVHRETKQCDGKMDDIERHIAEEEKRIQRLHPSDAKHNCDQIENELKHVEDSLKSMARDVQTLRDGRYHQALELQKRVQQLHERFLNLRMNFQTRVLHILTTRSLKVEEKKVTKPRPLSLEKLIETNKSFKFLQECIDWVQNKLKYLEEAEYGTDLPSVQSLLEQHHTEHRIIDQFQNNVDQCSISKTQFRGEELELYCKLLSKLEKSYSEVLVMSNKRMSDLDTLLDFIQTATNELIWMNEKEEVEVSRDWSSKSLNIPDIEDYQKSLTTELESREVQFNAVQDRGESLVLQKHPASKCIEAYLAAMQTQWSWLLQLMSCLDVHLKYAYQYHQFFDEAKECQQWLKQIENRLTTTYSRQNFSIDEGERLMKEMQELRDELSHYSNVVSSLIERSKDVAPLKQRRQPLPRPLRVTAVCSYKQQSMSVSKDDHCWLHDNTSKTKWKVINAHGVEGMVPGVCFVIPPPNPEALELAESLKRQFETIVNLWTSKQRKLRQNMIFATIKIIKSWDITKFRSIEPIQRESIIKALNEDTQKLLNEGSSDDPALKRLQEEIAYCNKLFADLQRMLDQDEVDKVNKSQARKFNDLVALVQSTLTDKERILKQRTQAPIPRSKELVHRLLQEQRDFEVELRSIEPRVDEVRNAFRDLAAKTPALQSRHDAVMESWNNLWSISNLYIDRCKAVDLTLGHYEEAAQVVSSVELQLVSMEDMTSDVESASRIEESLRIVKREMQVKLVVIEQVTESVVTVRHLVELSRPHQTVHSDVSKLEEDVKKVRRRWDLAGTQVSDRLRALETSLDLLQSYKGKYAEQKAFVSQMSTQVESMKCVSRLDHHELHREIESSTSVYRTLSQRKAAIEDTNVDGGRFVREAKIYDLHLRQYQDGLDDNPAASEAKRAKLVSAAEIVSQELDVLNQEYTDLVNTLMHRLNELKTLISSQEDQKYSVTIIQAAPIILKTYRTELIWEQVPFSSSSHTNHNHTSNITSTTSIIDSDNSRHRNSSDISLAHKIPRNHSTENSPRTFSTVIDVNMDDNDALCSENPLTQLSGTTLSFTEVKSYQKFNATNSSKTTVFEKEFIYDTATKTHITFIEALFKNIINIRIMKYIDIETRLEYNFESAVLKKYISRDFLNSINKYYGIFDPKYKTEVTLLEAIQRNIFNPSSGSFMNPITGKDVCLEEAAMLGLVSKEKIVYLIENNIVSCNQYLISEAVLKGLLDADSGIFTSPFSRKNMSIPEAYKLGYLYTAPPIIEDSFSLSEALDSGLINDEGKVCDPDSGRLYSVNEALKHGILSKRLTEVVDTSIGNIVTIPVAISNNLISIETGCYVHSNSGKEISLKKAQLQKLIMPPLTIKSAYEKGIIEDDGLVINIINSNKVSFIRAAVIGIFSFDVKCIVSSEDDKLLTLAEALVLGVITPDCKFYDSQSNEILTLAQAANRGFLASVDRRMIFDIEGFKDTLKNDYVSFNTAVVRNIISMRTGYVHDLSTGLKTTMARAVENKLVIPQVYEMLNKTIGIFKNGIELTVLNAVIEGYLDPSSGYLIDPTTKLPVRLIEAVEKEMITEEGAITLKSLLTITVTLTSVTKTTTRYVTVANQSFGSDLRITFDEAFSQGLIDEKKGTFKDPVSGTIMPVEEAYSKGYLSILPSSSSESRVKQTEMTIFKNNLELNKNSTVHAEESMDITDHNSVVLSKCDKIDDSNIDTHRHVDYSTSRGFPLQNGVFSGLFYPEISKMDENFRNEIEISNCYKDTNNITSQFRNSISLIPAISLKEAIENGAFNPDTGYWDVLDTKERITLEESIRRGYLNPESAYVISPDSKHRVYIKEAIQLHLLSPIGYYLKPDKQIPMSNALKLNLVLFADDSSDTKKIEIDSKSIVFNRIVSNTKIETMDIGIEAMESRTVCEQSTEMSGRNEKITAESNQFHSSNEVNVIGSVIPVNTLEFNLNSNAQDISGFVATETTNALQSVESSSDDVMIVNTSEAKSDAILNTVQSPLTSENPISLNSEKVKNDKIEISDPKNYEIDEFEDKRKMTKKQYSEPRFEVTIGTAQSVASPAKAVVLKKVKRKKVPANYAAEKGITDKKTADTLQDIENLSGPDGKPLSLEDAVRLSIIDGNKGMIKNLKNNETLNINQALDNGLLDPQSGQFMIPVGRSLSIPEAVNQGLVEPIQQKIVHPEHGEHLSIQDAIVCEIIDPLSEMTEPTSGKNLTLEKAIDTGIIDGIHGNVQTWEGTISMLEAVELNIFELLPSVHTYLPPLAATFPVALRQGFISIESRSYIHPISKKSTPLLKAIEQGLILGTTELSTDSSIYLWTALEKNLIQPDTCTMINPVTKEVIPIEEAVDSGLLFITSEIPDHPSFKEKTKSYDTIPKKVTALQVYILSDLLKHNLVDTNKCYVSLKNGKRILLISGLKEKFIFHDSLVEIKNENEVTLLTKSVTEANKKSVFDLNVAVSSNGYDTEKNVFLNAKKHSVPFSSFIEEHIIDHSQCRVKNQKTLAFVSIKEAFSCLLIDKDTGMILDAETGVEISCFEAASKCLIASTPKGITLDIKNLPPMTFKEAIEKDFFDLNAAEIQIPGSFQSLPVNEALMCGVIISSSVMVYNVQKDMLMPISEACEISLVNIERDIYIHPITSQELSFQDAFKRGLLVPKQNAISLEAAMKLGLVNYESGLITDPVTKLENNIEASVRRGLIDAGLTLIKDTEKDSFLTLEEAILNRVVLKSGKVKNTLTKKLLNFDEALSEGLIKTVELHLPLVQALNQFYDEESGQFFNPMVCSDVTLKQAIDTHFINSESAKVRHFNDNLLYSLLESITVGLIDPHKGIYNAVRPMNLKHAMDKGLIFNSCLPLTLSEALENNFYNADTGFFVLSSENEQSLHQLIQEKVIIDSALTVFDARSCDNLSLKEAIEKSIIDPYQGTFQNPFNEKELSLYEAYDFGLILPLKKQLTFTEAINSIYYIDETCTYFDYSSQRVIPLNVAVSENCVDVQETFFCDVYNQEIYSFTDAVEQHIIDLSNGKVYIENLKEHISIRDAVEREYVLNIVSFSLKDSIKTAIYHKPTGLFLDPVTKNNFTLGESIDKKLIDSDSVVVKDFKNDNELELSLTDAIQKHLVDPEKAVVCVSSDKIIPIDEALELGYVYEKFPAVSLQKALCNNLFKAKPCKFTFPGNANMTLRDCLQENLIDGHLVCYWDEKFQRVLSVNEAIKKGMINSISGTFKNEDQCISLIEALQKGVIVDTEKTFSLYDILKFNLCVKSGKLINPRNGVCITLKTACLEGVVSPQISFIKTVNGKSIMLSSAIEQNIIDDIAGTYNLNSKESISLREAYNRKLIIPFSKPCSFDQALQMQLFHKKSGRFTDPITNCELTLEEAIGTGLIQDNNVAVRDNKRQTLKTLRLAMLDGTINSKDGTFVFCESNTSIGLDEAFEQQLILIVEEDFLEKFIASKLDLDPSVSVQCSIGEAIDKKIIEPKDSFIKDPETANLITVEEAIKKKIINLRKKVVLCHISKRTDSLIIKYDNKSLYKSKPIPLQDAVEKKQLNILSGIFTHPNSKEIFSLKESIELGYIDSNSAIIKDVKNNNFSELSLAFTNNTLDPDRGVVLNTFTNQILTLKGALNSGLLLTYPHLFSLIELLEYQMYDPETNLVKNPFNNISETFEKVITSDLVDPLSTLIKDPATGEFFSINDAIEKGILCTKTGCLMNLSNGDSTTLTDAYQQRLLVPSDKRMAIEEKFRLWTDSTSKLLSWLQEKEFELADLGQVREDADDLFRQISAAKVIRDDLDDHQRPVMLCIDQAQQLIEQGQEVLSKDELQNLQKNSDALKKRFNRANEESEKLLRRLNTALEELRKFSNELVSFMDWLKEAHIKQSEKEKSLVDLERLKEHADTYKVI